MIKKIFNDCTAGWIGKILLIVITSFWCMWSVGEMYHEGWWGPFYIRLIYLIPGTAFLILTLVGIKWPQVGGWLIIVLGGLFTLSFLDISVIDGKLTMGRDLAGFLVSGPLVFLGVLLLVEARNQKRRIAQGWVPHSKWWRRNIWYLLAVGPPLLILIGWSIQSLPIVLTRVDDRDLEARLIEGNGVTLVWAPEGPGWNWRQDYGGFPSWNMIALYGLPPVGMGDKPGHDPRMGVYASAEEMESYNVCLYLSENGLTLAPTPQNIWRMPTVDDYARSFARHGENAGCIWRGKGHDRMECEILPDKETPLWAPDLDPIYYWAAEEYDDREAYFVSYNGWVNTAYKTGGNPRHSYRCVRDP
ncbi:MAG: hypothetical protein GX597_16010 [Anaerolineaceae bacterium]|nr:hypothetical protein [Anaerolineaceae bacterium]